MTPTAIPAERSGFKHLLLANPNHFGTLGAANLPVVLAMKNNTTYEQLTCVGFSPTLNMLQATFQLKLPVGYAGDLCSGGSREYVRFFVDYGSGWIDAGYASTEVHDIPNANDCANAPQKPLTYIVTVPHTPQTDYCGKPVLPNVRGVLSWEAVPSLNPNLPPVWGNVLDHHVQIKPRSWIFADLAKVISTQIDKTIKLPPPLEQAQTEIIPLPDPEPETLQSLAKMYASPAAGTDLRVEPHRFGLSSVVSVMSPGALHPEAVSLKMQEWKAAQLDWSAAIKALQDTSGNTTYEQLDCVGLDNNRDWLVATFHIKRPSGYSGGLCTAGSKEYITFWVDWENQCKWTYLDTIAVKVHDITPMPADGIWYTVVRPVAAELAGVRQGCSQPRIARVRAVLGWSHAPSATNPDEIPYWGNRIETHVQIAPKTVVKPGPIISILGGVGVADINIFGNGLTKPFAKFALTGSNADPWDPTRSCPFGAQIVVQGPPFTGYFYRVWARKSGADPFAIVKNPIWTVNYLGQGVWRNPVNMVDGFFAYIDNLFNIDDTLAYWYTSGDDLGQIYLEIATLPFPANVFATSAIHNLRLRHTAPEAAISIDGGACDVIKPGTIMTGRFVARDTYFGTFGLSTAPASLSPPAPSTATASTSQTAPSPGDPWTLNTTGMAPCGYVVRVDVYDRTILNSGPSAHNHNFDDKGFCLRA